MSLYGLNQRQDGDFGFHLILDLTVFHLAALQGSLTLAQACMVKTKHIFSIKRRRRGAAATVFGGERFVKSKHGTDGKEKTSKTVGVLLYL